MYLLSIASSMTGCYRRSHLFTRHFYLVVCVHFKLRWNIFCTYYSSAELFSSVRFDIKNNLLHLCGSLYDTYILAFNAYFRLRTKFEPVCQNSSLKSAFAQLIASTLLNYLKHTHVYTGFWCWSVLHFILDLTFIMRFWSVSVKGAIPKISNNNSINNKNNNFLSTIPVQVACFAVKQSSICYTWLKQHCLLSRPISNMSWFPL